VRTRSRSLCACWKVGWWWSKCSCLLPLSYSLGSHPRLIYPQCRRGGVLRPRSGATVTHPYRAPPKRPHTKLSRLPHPGRSPAHVSRCSLPSAPRSHGADRGCSSAASLGRLPWPSAPRPSPPAQARGARAQAHRLPRDSACESSVCEPGRHVAVATAVDTSSRAIIVSRTGGPIICRNPIACAAHRPVVVSCRAGPQADTLCGCDWLMYDGDRRAVTRWRLCALPGLCEGVWPGGGCAWKAGSCRGLCAFPGL